MLHGEPGKIQIREMARVRVTTTERLEQLLKSDFKKPQGSLDSSQGYWANAP